MHFLFMCLCLIYCIGKPVLCSTLSTIYEDDFMPVKLQMFNCLLVAYKMGQEDYNKIPEDIHNILDSFKDIIDNNEWNFDGCSEEYFNLIKTLDIFKKKKEKKLKIVINKCLRQFYKDLRPLEDVQSTNCCKNCC
ncbi:uncharacterized protein LOC126905664 [Daktulosphaira vitifoliae]|uniref:uncharacterized protein LOC126905664 n=1 Tax=Daktulosphaira vitifoliae TaxID=58002 RepID=UPI0021A9B89E|nr:uncharacterized protein LOC126905664 [Daktulosphaira vitifoliae]